MYKYDLLTSLFLVCFQPQKLRKLVKYKRNKLIAERQKIFQLFENWEFTSVLKVDGYEISPIDWEMPKDNYYINDFCCLLSENRLAFNSEYKDELTEFINDLISLSKIHTIGLIFYSDGVDERIEGVYSCSEFMDKLKNEEIYFNKLYLIQSPRPEPIENWGLV